MCEADAYMVHNGQEDVIMTDVDLVEPQGKDDGNW